MDSQKAAQSRNKRAAFVEILLGFRRDRPFNGHGGSRCDASLLPTIALMLGSSVNLGSAPTVLKKDLTQRRKAIARQAANKIAEQLGIRLG
jgi:hypothetical protein